MKSVDLLQLIREQYIRAWGWIGGHAQNIKDILIALLKCDKYIMLACLIFKFRTL